MGRPGFLLTTRCCLILRVQASPQKWLIQALSLIQYMFIRISGTCAHAANSKVQGKLKKNVLCWMSDCLQTDWWTAETNPSGLLSGLLDWFSRLAGWGPRMNYSSSPWQTRVVMSATLAAGSISCFSLQETKILLVFRSQYSSNLPYYRWTHLLGHSKATICASLFYSGMISCAASLLWISVTSQSLCGV